MNLVYKRILNTFGHLSLTPKGECFFKYVAEKAEGKDVFIQEYEDEIQSLSDIINEGTKRVMDGYFKRFPNVKIIQATVLVDNYDWMGINKGDVINIYDKPFFDGFNLFSLIGFKKKYLFANKDNYGMCIYPKHVKIN